MGSFPNGPIVQVSLHLLLHWIMDSYLSTSDALVGTSF